MPLTEPFFLISPDSPPLPPLPLIPPLPFLPSFPLFPFFPSLPSPLLPSPLFRLNLSPALCFQRDHAERCSPLIIMEGTRVFIAPLSSV
ncbi:MAG: hypothetical protein CVV64_13140 [Candidatus Wallbacteria bacterium HGW-Wallbacteria-1]|uniref:Uncharacterized protein n=1 Tax=Candidatus Wallbacteria bacterium HGW-Wallbacteria-1 TaxID=2013854 RepID=A0A2N1PN97_9BACT|nr:MAG: hypothetical protein CVV64_13140 [Candidatus Wallbacteria bacterium HGW-Wallbacteria-1]